MGGGGLIIQHHLICSLSGFWFWNTSLQYLYKLLLFLLLDPKLFLLLLLRNANNFYLTVHSKTCTLKLQGPDKKIKTTGPGGTGSPDRRAISWHNIAQVYKDIFFCFFPGKGGHPVEGQKTDKIHNYFLVDWMRMVERLAQTQSLLQSAFFLFIMLKKKFAMATMTNIWQDH